MMSTFFSAADAVKSSSWFTILIILIDMDPKLVPRKENTEHGLEVRKIY